jgi:hypothetical protein
MSGMLKTGNSGYGPAFILPVVMSFAVMFFGPVSAGVAQNTAKEADSYLRQGTHFPIFSWRRKSMKSWGRADG